VALDGLDGLFLDITGVSHLWDGEAAMLDDLLTRLAGNGIPARGVIADTAGAAWALARYGAARSLVDPVGGQSAAPRPPAGGGPAAGRSRDGPAAATRPDPGRPAARTCRAPS
jgi:protein ImuB